MGPAAARQLAALLAELPTLQGGAVDAWRVRPREATCHPCGALGGKKTCVIPTVAGS